MKFRSLLISVLVLLMVILPAATSAQDFDTCLGLAEADCAELQTAGANLATFATSTQSFTITFDVALNASGLPEEEAGASSGAFNADGAIDVVMGGNGSIPFTIGGVINSEFGMDGAMQSMPIEFRLVEDFMYILNPMSGAWQGANVAEEFSDTDFSTQLEELNPMGSGEAGSMMDAETLSIVTSILDLPGLVTHVRDGDNFIFTLDLTVLGLLGTPEYADKLATIQAKLNELSEGSGDQLAAYVPLIPMVLQEGTITVTQTLNSDLGIVDNVAINADLAVDGAMISGTPGVMDVTLDFNIGITNVDAAPSAVAPAEFEEVDPSELMSNLGM
jgi:hypothetical protein